MTTFHDVFKSKYFKAAQLKTKELTTHITRYALEKPAEDEGDKLVLYFEGQVQGLVCNKTNASILMNHYGEEIDQWVNKPITLYADMTTFGGKLVDCIRVRMPTTSNVA